MTSIAMSQILKLNYYKGSSLCFFMQNFKKGFCYFPRCFLQNIKLKCRSNHSFVHKILCELSYHNKKLYEAAQIHSKLIRGVISQKTGVLLSAAMLLSNDFNFEINGISDAVLEEYRNKNEIDKIKDIIDGTIKCDICGKRKVLQNKTASVEYCTCKSGNTVNWNANYDGWKPFLERGNVLVWRKEHYPNLYAYKVYGHLDDVSMRAFVETQLNTSYRTEWDHSVIELSVIATDYDLMEREKNQNLFSAQDLLYWVVKFPRFFADRDYVFKRRYRVDNQRKEVVIINESEKNSCFSMKDNSNHRVEEYWSVMVVRAKNYDYNQPGIEYVLSYFDNPGTSLPSSITNFIAYTAFPNFLNNLHTASLSLQNSSVIGENVYTSLPLSIIEEGIQRQHEEEIDRKTKQIIRILNISEQLSEYLEVFGELTSFPRNKEQVLQDIIDLLNGLIGNIGEDNPHIKSITSAREKIEQFLVNCRQIKCESKPRRKMLDRYEDDSFSAAVILELFDAMREVLKQDMEMRTGPIGNSQSWDYVPSWSDWLYENFINKPSRVFHSPKKKNEKVDSDKNYAEPEEELIEQNENNSEKIYYNVHWPSMDKPEIDVSSYTSVYQKHNILNETSHYASCEDVGEKKTEDCTAGKGNETTESWYLISAYKYVVSFFYKF